MVISSGLFTHELFMHRIRRRLRQVHIHEYLLSDKHLQDGLVPLHKV